MWPEMAGNGDQQMALGEEEEEEGFEFHLDVLERILSHVPLVDLVSASRVSKSWSAAVSSSLRRHNKPRPWLILHAQDSARAYDPRSDVWIQMSRPPPMTHITGIRSSHSNFIYMLSSSRFSFSSDPLNLQWHHVDPPLVWRQDPIVARVGDSVVIAGGGCDFEDEPLAVEIYDLNARIWHFCDAMPGNLRDSAASSWLSIAVAGDKLIVADRLTGETHWFDPKTKSWTGPFDLRTGEPVKSYNIGCTNNNSLVLVGLCRFNNEERIKIWRVAGEDFECEEIGEMPAEFVVKLRNEHSGKCSINVRAAGNIVYVYRDTCGAAEVVACELVAGGGCRWWSVRKAALAEGRAERMVITCGEVGMEELQRGMRAVEGRLELEVLEH